MRTGIIFATEKEAAPFREHPESREVVIAVSGMGPEAARRITLRLIEKEGVERVLNAGVCGALADGLERYSIHTIHTAVNGDIGDHGVPVAVQPEGEFPVHRLVSVSQPVFEEGRRKALACLGELVDMEGYAVAQVCAEKGIPCSMIKGVTDFGGPEGREDIQQHIHSVSKKVAAAVVCLLSAGEEKISESVAEGGLLRRMWSFIKVEHTVFSLPLLFAGAWIGAGGVPPWKTGIWIALVGLGARTFGMAVNRIFDRHIDAKNPRTALRELPRGALSLSQAVVVATVGLILYFLGCALLGKTVLLLSWLPLIPLGIYSLLKRFTPLCHYGIGICLALAPLGAHVAVTNSLGYSTNLLWLGLFTFGWISGFDIIYALMDIDFDRTHGVRSIPASFGVRKALWIAGLTHLVAWSALVPLVSGWASLVAALVAAAGFIAAYVPQIPVDKRFFPLSVIAGIAGALVVLLG